MQINIFIDNIHMFYLYTYTYIKFVYIYNLETNNAKDTTTHGRPFPTGCLFIDG